MKKLFLFFTVAVLISCSAPNKKIILDGDSISSTDYPWYKQSMESLTRENVYNAGFSGYNVAQCCSQKCIQRIFDYQPNLIIGLWGANDTGEAGSVGTFGANADEPTVLEPDVNEEYNGKYFIQAVSYKIRKIQMHYYNIRTNANLTGKETEKEKEAKIDAVPKPLLVLCTPLPEQRINASNPFSQEANWIRKRNAIIECCKKYNVECIDLQNLVNWRHFMNLEPYWNPPTNKVCNNGIYTMDGLHPNKYGFQEISEIICRHLDLAKK